MDMLRRFTCLTRLQIEDAWTELPGGGPEPIPLLDFGSCCSLANLTVLKVTFRQCEVTDNYNGRGVNLVIPATWRLRTLVVASVETEGAKEPVVLNFNDPDLAAQHLEDLFVAGLELTSHLMLMADAFKARGLMLSAAKCPDAESGFNVYLKELAAAPSSFAALFEKYVRLCDCGVCWNCCMSGMGL
jgi:hypothetical protein